MALRPPLPLLMQKLTPAKPTVSLHTRPVVPHKPVGNGGTDKGYWRGWVPDMPYQPMSVPNDRPVYQLPVLEQLPEATDPQAVVWVNANCPPWVCPPYWSQPIELTFEHCVPWYEVDTVLGNIVAPKDYFYVVTSASYQALNAAQDDVFEWSLLVQNNLVARWEDISADAAQPNPANQNGLAGYQRPMPCRFICDRNQTITARARLRGQINLAGVSPNWPGQPILTGNCHMKIILNGWMANLRENVDGGPRPTDLGDFGFIFLEDDQSGRQA